MIFVNEMQKKLIEHSTNPFYKPTHYLQKNLRTEKVDNWENWTFWRFSFSRLQHEDQDKRLLKKRVT